MCGEIVLASQLLEYNTVKLDRAAKEFSSASFWYYASINTVSSILNGHSFFVNNFNSMNDKDEANIHKDEADDVYALCFCNSNSEKIPMWYLYAGLSGKGASIGFTPSIMLEFINSITAIKSIDKNEFYIREKDFDIVPGWIFYRDYDNRYNYKGKWYQLDKTENNFFINKNYFIKNYPWEYEKEFRIVIINKTTKKWGKIELVFPEEMRAKLKIRIAPELKKKDAMEYISKLEGFKKYFGDKILYSNLNVNMSLFERNIGGIYSFVEQTLKDNPQKVDTRQLFDIIKGYLPEQLIGK